MAVKYRGQVLVPFSKRREREAEEAIRQSDVWAEDMPMELIDSMKVCFQLKHNGLRLKEMPKVVREHRPFVEGPILYVDLVMVLTTISSLQ
eukprot:g17633.t1